MSLGDGRGDFLYPSLYPSLGDGLFNKLVPSEEGNLYTLWVWRHKGTGKNDDGKVPPHGCK